MNVTIPMWMLEALYDVAIDYRGQNEWKRNASERMRREIKELDTLINDVREYLK